MPAKSKSFAFLSSRFYCGEEADQFHFLRIPYLLLRHPRYANVSNDAKLLYALMLSRMELSRKNGWQDADGRIYIYYTIEDICTDLHCGHDKAIKLLRELDCDDDTRRLICRVRQGQGKPDRIYVLRFADPDAAPEKLTLETVEEALSDAPANALPDSQSSDYSDPVSAKAAENVENCTSTGLEAGISDSKNSTKQTAGSLKKRSQDVGNPDANYNNKKNNDVVNLYPSIPATELVHKKAMMDRRILERKIECQIDVPRLREMHPCEELDSLIILMTDVFSSNESTLRIGKHDTPIEDVQARFEHIEYDHIVYVLESVRASATPIRNIRAYLLTALYNSIDTIDAYYAAEARRDLAKAAG